jgi:hypothetical protein
MFKRIIVNHKWIMITALLLFVFAPLVIGPTILYAIAPPNGEFVSEKNANGIGTGAANMGITSYSASNNNGEIIVKYSGASNGILHISLSSKNVLTLINDDSDGSSNIEWDIPNGKFTYIDAKNRSCIANLDLKAKEWSMDSQTEKILKENSKKIQLMGAIATDFDLLDYDNNKDDNDKGLRTELCPDYWNPVEGSASAVQRSVACYNAGQDAAVQCSGALCIGCLEYLDCDCVCLPYAGDYFCHCEQIGFPCKEC